MENRFKNPVLVTGGSGYIASWVVRKLLERGYSVRTTVRSLQNTERIDHLLQWQSEFGDALKLYEADLLHEGSFDEPAAGCTAIIHMASPFMVSKPRNVQSELIDPAEKGTEFVLSSALKSDTVKRVVLTSSVAAVHNDNNEWKHKSNGMLNEDDWNEIASEKYQPYSYSKTLAEKAAWRFAEGQSQFDLVVINPSFVIGPSLSKRLDGTSTSSIASIFSGQFKSGIPDLHFGIVDVRDVAEAHIRALEKKECSGRHILCSGARSMVELAGYLKEEYGDKLPASSRKLPKFLFYLLGPFLGFSWRYTANNYGVPVKLDSSKSVKDLGLEYRDIKQTVLDHGDQLLRDGLVSLDSSRE